MWIRGKGNKPDEEFNVGDTRGGTHTLEWEDKDKNGFWYGVWVTQGGTYTIVDENDKTRGSRLTKDEAIRRVRVYMIGQYERGSEEDPTIRIRSSIASGAPQKRGEAKLKQAPSKVAVARKERHIGDVDYNGWTLVALGPKYEVWKSPHGNYNVATTYPEVAITPAWSWDEVQELLQQKFETEGTETPMQHSMELGEIKVSPPYPREKEDPRWKDIDLEMRKRWIEGTSGKSRTTYEQHMAGESKTLPKRSKRWTPDERLNIPAPVVKVEEM